MKKKYDYAMACAIAAIEGKPIPKRPKDFKPYQFKPKDTETKYLELCEQQGWDSLTDKFGYVFIPKLT